MIRKLWYYMYHNPFERNFLRILFITNIFGSIYGYYWYYSQLLSTKIALWIFVPDSPLSSTLMALTLLMFLRGRRPSFLALLACVSVIKYGLWAAVINGDILAAGEQFTRVNLMLMLSHLGMALEGVMYLRHIRYGWGQLYAVAGWLVLQDVMDYGFGLHPYLFSARQLAIAQITAVALTVAIVLGIRKGLRFDARRLYSG